MGQAVFYLPSMHLFFSLRPQWVCAPNRKLCVAKLKYSVSGPNTVFFSVSKWAWPNGEGALNNREHAADCGRWWRCALGLPCQVRHIENSVKIQDVTKSKHIIEECGVYKELISRSGLIFQNLKLQIYFADVKKPKKQKALNIPSKILHSSYTDLSSIYKLFSMLPKVLRAE